MLIIVPNLLNVVLKNSSVIELLPPTNIVIPLRGVSAAEGSGEEVGAGKAVFDVEDTKLLYKFCKHNKHYYYYYYDKLFQDISIM